MDPRDAAESTGHYSRGRSASARYRDARSAGKHALLVRARYAHSALASCATRDLWL